MKTKLRISPKTINTFHPFFEGLDGKDWKTIDPTIGMTKNKREKLESLSDFPDNSLEHVYIASLLETIPHDKLFNIFDALFEKLEKGGKLSIFVSDLAWSSGQVVKFENGQLLTSYYTDFEGDTGLQSLIYGNQKSELDFIKSGFTKTSLLDWLEGMFFKDISIIEVLDDRNVGVLLATAYKK